MKKIILSLSIVLLLVLILNLAVAQPVQPSQGVCCCTSTTATFVQAQTCPQGQTSVSATVTTACASACQISTEVNTCDSPSYTIKIPQITSITPERGEHKLKLNFVLDCQDKATKLNLKRCSVPERESDCSQYESIPVPLSTEFIDDVKFGIKYKYILDAEYPNTPIKSSQPAFGNAGQIECFKKTTNEPFCVFESTYKEGEVGEYVTSNRYAYSEENYNAPFTCNANNEKVPVRTPVNSCGDKEACQVKIENSVKTAKCVKLSDCNLEENPFGVFYSKTICESKEGCYYDKSSTLFNKCYSCPENTQKSCYDYKSKDACQSARCGPSTCQWNDIYSSIGTGVCVDTTKYNCENCDKTGNEDATAIFNSIFDVCTRTKSDALQIITNDAKTTKKCLFDSGKSKNCDKITCKDYKTQEDCNKFNTQIQLQNDNKIVSESEDQCDVKVCEFSGGNCFKNSDGQILDASGNRKDCKGSNEEECEKDFFPPETTLTTTKKKGSITDSILISIKDKKERNGEYKLLTNRNDYTTYLCFTDKPTEECNQASQFPISTKAPKILVENGKVFVTPTEVLKQLSEGQHTLKYFTKDPYNNLEVVQTKTVEACSNCQGPKAIFEVKNSKEHGGIFYVRTVKPEVKVKFLTSSKILYAKITDGKEERNYEFQPQTSSTEFTLTLPTTVSLADGNYRLEIKAQNNQGLSEGPEVINIIVDNKSPGLVITPANMASIPADKNTKDVDTKLKLNEIGNITSANLNKEIPVSEYAALREQENIRGEFLAEFSTEFNTKLEDLKEGKYQITANAQDIAGNTVSNTSTFFVAGKENKILLVTPTFGTSQTTPFNIEVHTTKKSECKYTTNPDLTATDFDEIVSSFATQDKYNHTVNNFDEITKFDEQNSLKTFCKGEDKKITEQEFILMLDKTPPEILKTEALQDTLSTPTISVGGEDLYTTNISVLLDEPGFCQYSKKKEGTINSANFFEYELVPKKLLTTEVNMSEPGIYDFEISCKNSAGLQAKNNPKTVKITVDKNLPLEITSTTPESFKTKDITLSVKTNKIARCTYKENPTGNQILFQKDLSTKHEQKLVGIKKPGELQYYITCTTPLNEKAEKTIKTLVDYTPPEQVKVQIFSDSTEEPFVVWQTDKLRVKFSAVDNETGIKGFWYKIESAGKIISDWQFTNRQSGEEFYITTTNEGQLQLLNGAEYIIKAKAVNNFDLNSTEVLSKTKVDILRKPQPCQNKQQDQGELGIDCGGNCEPCPEQTFCTKDIDCATGSCVNNKCVVQACNNGNFDKDSETDKDCGNKCTKKCDVAQKCVSNTDCASSSCKSGKCATPKPLQGTDVNCGGEYEEKCEEGKGCLADKDCESNLACSKDKKCQKASDKDNDGIPDIKDKCANTPPNSRDKVKKDGATAGCTPEQLEEPEKPSPTKTTSPTPTKTVTPSPTTSPGKTPTKSPSPTKTTPTTEGKPWLKYGLIVLILAALGYGAFYAYQMFAKKPEEPEEFPGLGPLPRQIEMPQINKPTVKIPPKHTVRPISPIKKPIIPKLKPKIAIPKKEEFIPIEVLKERVKGKEKKDVFEKLKKYQPKKEPKLEHEESKSDVFEKLKKYKKKV